MPEPISGRAKIGLIRGRIDVAGQLQPGAADFLREIAGEKFKFNDIAFYLLGKIIRHIAATLQLVFMRVDLVFNDAAHGRDDHLVFLRKAKIRQRPPGIAAWRRASACSLSRTASEGLQARRVVRLTCSNSCSAVAISSPAVSFI